LGYCISVGVRLIMLAFLQLIAPIPILSYLGQDKDGVFGKWAKKCLSTFLDLFIRLAIIYFVIFIISLLIVDESNSTSLFTITAAYGTPGWFTLTLLKVIVIVSLLVEIFLLLNS